MYVYAAIASYCIYFFGCRYVSKPRNTVAGAGGGWGLGVEGEGRLTKRPPLGTACPERL